MELKQSEMHNVLSLFRVSEKKTLLKMESEKYPVVSIVGGDSAITSMDLSPLHGKTVLIWPDNDWEGSSKNSGMRCAKRMAEMLKDLADVKIVNPPNQDKPSGWDLGDAFTTDGWTFKEFAEYVQANTTVYGGYNPNDIEFSRRWRRHKRSKR